MNIIDVTSAIKALRPNAKFMVRGDTYEGIENWVDGGEPPPTRKEIESEIIRQQADYDAKSYARARASQYPSIIDVVVALAEKEEGNDTMWQEITAQRAKVKSDNPKPE